MISRNSSTRHRFSRWSYATTPELPMPDVRIQPHSVARCVCAAGGTFNSTSMSKFRKRSRSARVFRTLCANGLQIAVGVIGKDGSTRNYFPLHASIWCARQIVCIMFIVMRASLSTHLHTDGVMPFRATTVLAMHKAQCSAGEIHGVYYTCRFRGTTQTTGC